MTQLNLMGIIMKKISALIFLTLLTIIIWVSPATTDAEYLTLQGYELLEFCESESYEKQLKCKFYLTGFNEAHTVLSYASKVYEYCPPSGVSPAQLSRVVTKYINSNPHGLKPDYLKESAALLVVLAFKESFPFPCSK